MTALLEVSMGIDPTSTDMNTARQADDIANAEERARLLDGGPSPAAAPSSAQVTVGARVIAAGGVEIGTVEETTSGYFKLSREGDENSWLSDMYIESSDASSVKLTFEAPELDGHSLRQPGLQTLHRELGGTGTRFQTELDSLHVRERMEHELVRQRGTMDTGVQQTPDA